MSKDKKCEMGKYEFAINMTIKLLIDEYRELITSNEKDFVQDKIDVLNCVLKKVLQDIASNSDENKN